MNVTRIYAIVLRQLFLIRRNPTRFINIFIWVTLDIIVWGFITKYLATVEDSGFAFVPAFLGAAILWNILVRVQQGVILAFFEDMWSRNFLNLFASPLKVHEYIVGLVGTAIITSSAGFATMTAVGAFAFGYNLFSIGVPLLAFVLVLVLSGLVLGLLTTGLVLRFGPSAEWFGWVMPWALSPFSGVFYPTTVLPEAMHVISRALPTSYVFEGLRALVHGGEFLAEPLIFGTFLAFAYLVLAYIGFLAIFRVVVRKGLLARASAES